MSGPVALHTAASQARWADKWISQAAGGTVVALAGLAGAISYSHMRQLAQQHGQAGWHAHVFPLSVDGIEIVASLVLLADHRAGRRAGWLPWVALMIGTAGSMAANVATAGPGIISQIVAGWPALALLIAVKLLSGMLNRPVDSEGQAARAMSVTASRHHELRNPEIGRSRESGPPAAASRAPGLAELLPVARAARDGLHHDGRRLTRDSLAARLRETGHPIRNSRLTQLLHALRSETAIIPDPPN